MDWITEHHRDNVCDIVWWLKGYMAAAKDSFENCPFTEGHHRTLSCIAEGMREELNKREEHLKENPPFGGPYNK